MAQQQRHGHSGHPSHVHAHRHRHAAVTQQSGLPPPSDSGNPSAAQGSTQQAKFAPCKHCDARINLRGVIIGATGDSCTHEFQFHLMMAAPEPSRPDPPRAKPVKESWEKKVDRIPSVVEAEKFRDISYLFDLTNEKILKYQTDIKTLQATYSRVVREISANFDFFIQELQRRRQQLSVSVKGAYDERLKELNDLKRTMVDYKNRCHKGKEEFASILERDAAGQARDAKQVEKADKIIGDCPIIFDIPLAISFSEAGAKLGLEEDIRAFGMVISDDVLTAKTQITEYCPRNSFGSSQVPAPIDPASAFESHVPVQQPQHHVPPSSQSMAPMLGHNGAPAYQPNPGYVETGPVGGGGGGGNAAGAPPSQYVHHQPARLAQPSPRTNVIGGGVGGGVPVSGVGAGVPVSHIAPGQPMVHPSVPSRPVVNPSPPKPVSVQMSAAAKSVTSVRASSASINEATGLIQLEMVIRGPRPPAKAGLTIACQVKEKSTGRVIHTEEGNALECHVNRARWKYTLKADLQSNPANNGTEILVEFRLMCPQTKQIVPKGGQWILFKESLVLRGAAPAQPAIPAKCYFFVEWKGTRRRVELTAPRYDLQTLKYKLIHIFKLGATGINVGHFRFDLVSTANVLQIPDVQDDSILLSTKYPANSHIYKAVLINESAQPAPSQASQSIPTDLYAKLPTRLAFFASPQWAPAERRVFIREVHGAEVTFETLKQNIFTRCSLDTMDFTMHILKGPYQGCQLTKKSDFGAIKHKTTVIELRK